MGQIDRKLMCVDIPWTRVMLVLFVVTVMAIAAVLTDSFFSVRVLGFLEVVVDSRSEQTILTNDEKYVLEHIQDFESKLILLEEDESISSTTGVGRPEGLVVTTFERLIEMLFH